MNTDATALLRALTPEQREHFIAVDRRTWSRWLEGRHRVPRAVLALAEILVNGSLEYAGAEWSGWHLARWGRSRSYTLQAPGGQRFTPREIMDIPRLHLDVDYLRARVRRLERESAGAFTPEESAVLRAAAAIIERRLPAPSRLKRQSAEAFALEAARAAGF